MKSPSRLALGALCDALVPGGRVVRVRPLRGGVSCSVHSVRLEAADAHRQDVVVRRYGEDWQTTDPDVCSREFHLLEVLARHAFPAPKPLFLDADGSIFGAPTLVMTRLRGRGLLTPRSLDAYLEQLAHALVELHRQPLAELSFLPEQRSRVARLIERRASTTPLSSQVWSAARAMWPSVAQAGRTALVHGDFWPGNTVWYRERLSGVIDWDMAARGDPVQDVATSRCDLTVLFDLPTADAFTRLYERAQGAPVEDLTFWDLFVSTGALFYMNDWVAGYHALGRADLSKTEAHNRVAAFARAALARTQD